MPLLTVGLLDWGSSVSVSTAAGEKRDVDSAGSV